MNACYEVRAHVRYIINQFLQRMVAPSPFTDA